jgi:DNA-3-methyladenine glycosylase II
MKQTITTLAPVPPYDFDLTAAYATYFRGHYGTEWFHDGVFRRLLDVGDRLCLIEVRSLGTVDSPSLEMELKSTALNDAVVSEARSQTALLLGVSQDLAPFYKMAFKDSVLTPLARDLRGLHIPQTVCVWEALVFAILGQQVSSHMAHNLRTLLVQTYGLSIHESGVTYHTFPRPEVLMGAGVEGMVASGERDLESLRALPDEEVIRTLTSIRGVGPWTAQWLLIRGLCRPDAFPHGDLALQRSLGLLLRDGSPFRPQEALKYSRRWSPFRSYVTTYIFAAARSGRFPELSSTANTVDRDVGSKTTYELRS